MWVLALDTTARGGSCALAHDGRVVAETAADPALPPASRLPGDLMRLLEDVDVPLTAIDVFAVATGPGSFTGMRVGIATMQGLAFASGKPLIGISALDALAGLAAGDRGDGAAPGRIAAWVDAWRGEVYAALYDGTTEIAAPTVEHPSIVLARLTTTTRFIGDGVTANRALIEQTLGARAVIAEPAAPLLAGAIAVGASELARRGCRPAPDAIRPVYVRRPDAELARDARPPR